jgi:hypothetical protein
VAPAARAQETPRTLRSAELVSPAGPRRPAGRSRGAVPPFMAPLPNPAAVADAVHGSEAKRRTRPLLLSLRLGTGRRQAKRNERTRSRSQVQASLGGNFLR